ncbi:MAG: riboflavin synthase [Helicobacteraceae bacterium]|jgi:riboflavin synthase|nr:riboflavin synthase [Helicobacteraceae bacterium]
MFTGLIREIAFASISGDRLLIKTAYRPNIGDSIAINGACLTVTSIKSDGFSADLSTETLKSIAAENLNGKVHIEPALKIGDRLEGHIVQGHIDCIGKIASIEKKNSGANFFISAPKEAMRLIAQKGSIAIDGVSLTISEIFSDSFRLTLIPRTLSDTLFGTYAANRRVNIETDLFARYTAQILGVSHIKEGDKKSWEQIDCAMALF